jgi:hypothetical protein
MFGRTDSTTVKAKQMSWSFYINISELFAHKRDEHYLNSDNKYKFITHAPCCASAV